MDNVYFIILILVFIIYFINHMLNKGDKKKNIINLDYIQGYIDKDCDYKPVDSNYRKAWTNEEINRDLKYHTSDIQGEKTDIGSFFDIDNNYNDTTSHRSTKLLPDNCILDGNGELFCNYNNKLQNIPPKLIKEGDKNKLIKSIGDDRNINTNVVSSKIINFSDNNYNVWEYENKKPINGGDFFNNVVGYNGDMDNVLEVDEKYNGKYSI